MQEAVFTAVVRALQRGEAAALVIIIATSGSTPQRVGAKMLVFEDGRTVGTIGGGCYENDAAGKARLVLASGRPQLLQYELNDDFAEESGLICGGRMDVFIEPVAPPPDLYVVGAGHVGFHLARVAAPLGYRLHVIDDRAAFANAERFPDAAEVVVDDIPAWLAQATFPRGSHVVVVTRGHRHDLEAVRALATRELAYLGLIGSRAKIARIFDALVEEGTPVEALRRIHAPIGLDIGAVTPEEIAVSIVAELIAVRRGRITYRDGQPAGAGAQALRWTPPALSRPDDTPGA
jgi:xanthine dehydrogenase accessory factor